MRRERRPRARFTPYAREARGGYGPSPPHRVAGYLAAASDSHFFMKHVLAAPASYFSPAWASHAAPAALVPASAPHFFMKLVLAAPASFFSAA